MMSCTPWPCCPACSNKQVRILPDGRHVNASAPCEPGFHARCPPIYPGPESVSGLGQFQLQRVLKNPLVKALAIGSLGASLAKAFPNQYIAPFVAGTVGAIITGIIELPESWNRVGG